MTDVLGLRNPEDDAMLASLAAAAASSPVSAAASASASSPSVFASTTAAAASPPPPPRDEFASFGSGSDEAPISAKIFSETTAERDRQREQTQHANHTSSRSSSRRSRSRRSQSKSRSRSRSTRSSSNRHGAGGDSSSSSSSRSPPHPSSAPRSSGRDAAPTSSRSSRSSGADLSAIGSDTMHMHAHTLAHNTPTRPHTSYSDASDRDHPQQHRSDRDYTRGDDHRASSKRSSGATTPASARYNTFGETDRANGSSLGGVSSHRSSGGNSHHRRSGESASSELMEARALLQHSDSLPHWLAAAGFDESISARLTAAGALSVPHALRLTKAGLKQLLGVKDGLRVHLALRDAEKAQQIIDEHAAAAAAFTAGGSDHSGAPSPASSRSRPPRLPASSYLPPSLADVPAGLSDSLVAPGGGIHRELHAAGMYGYCAVADCDLPAPVQCATKQCGKGLCNYHANKMLLTGSTVCASCYENTTIMDNVKQATGIVALQENGYLQQDCCIQ